MSKNGKKPAQKQEKKQQKGPCGDIVGSTACKKAKNRGASHCERCAHK